MSRSPRLRTFAQVDVFSAVPLGGNPVAVVLDAEGLDDEVMAAFARWANLSETTFVLPPTDPGADYRVRILTPGGEPPFAGHPTLGTAHAWLEAGGRPAASDRIVQQCGIGLVELRRDGRRLAFAAPPCQVSAMPPDRLAAITAALGLDPSDVQAARVLTNGPAWQTLLLPDAAAVLAIRPDVPALTPLGAVAVIGPHAEGDELAFEMRAFSPGDGIPEDPATGSLGAGVAQWLVPEGLAPASYVAGQGTAIGRTGRIHIRTDEAGTWVGGDTTTVVTGTVLL